MKHLFTLAIFIVHVAVCISVDITYHIPEEQPPGIFIGNIAFDSKLNFNMSDDDFRTLRYSFLTGGSRLSSMFTLNQSTGNLYTTIKLDREGICPFLELCVLSFETAAQSTIKSFFKKISVDIFIDDINDHSPQFGSPAIELEIRESVVVGTAFNIIGAKDLDTSSNYSIQKYSLEPDNLPFSLTFIKNLDGTSIVRLIVSSPLDREIRDSYQLKIIAQDGGHPVRSAELQVKVIILDENDNAPMLSNSIYNITVKEGVVKGTVILQLRAYDLDLGRNAQVRYGLSPIQSDTIKNLFAINETSGELSVRSTLLHGTYQIIVEVSDMGEQPLTTQTFVIVTIEDTGNNPPIIYVNLLNADNAASVFEDANTGQTVAYIQVEDRDVGNNGIVTCSLNTNFFDLQGIGINEYKVIVARPLDRETSSSHMITITCRDAGYPPLSFSRAFLVEVKDVNDNAPVFNMQTYSGFIAEDNNIGDVIIQVMADDADAGQNADVRYMMEQTNSTLVQIDSVSGLIRAKIVFDRETMPGFSFKVIAVDGGNPTRSGTASVVVRITDINDHTPEFAENLFIFRVEENIKLGSTIGSLTAYDKDEGDNGRVTFSDGGEAASFPFVLYSDGKIIVAKPIDRESTKFYNFSVIASDLGSPAKSSSARVSIYISDLNDNPPTFIFPTENNRTVLIPKSALPGTVVCKVRATDPDEGMNAQVEYFIDKRNDSGLFQIYSQLGDIVLQKPVDNLSGRKFILSITASDLGTPKQYKYETLEIIIVTDETSGLQTNIVIVVVLVGATIITSVCIIVAICIVRKLDFKRRNSKNKQIAQVSNSTNSNNVLIPNESTAPDEPSTENERKKKEVTFAFHVIDNPQSQMRFETRTNLNVPVGNFGETLSQKILRHQEDNNSETSGETNTSDSGRGLSDDEMNLHRGKDRQRQPGHVNLHPNVKSSHPFFHDGRAPISPIDHPKRQTKFSFDKNPSPNEGLIIGNTFYYHPKSPSFEDDSGSTSGIHTIDEEVQSVQFPNNVV